jgi:hypothetical protein
VSLSSGSVSLFTSIASPIALTLLACFGAIASIAFLFFRRDLTSLGWVGIVIARRFLLTFSLAPRVAGFGG